MIRCSICNYNILSHACFVKCSLCNKLLHSRCIPYYQNTDTDFTCENCLHLVFPFNNIESDCDFISAISGIPYHDLTQLNDMVYSPISVNDHENSDFIQLFESDPDLQFYNDFSVVRNISNCKYYNEDSFTKQSDNLNASAQSFSILHLNIRSLPRHLTELVCYLKGLEFPFTFIGLSETWLHDNNFACYSIDGYKIECMNRSGRPGGGVSILILDHLDYIRRTDLCFSSDFIECVFVEVFKSKINCNKHVILGVIYRPPNTNLEDFNNHLSDVLEIITRENKLIYLLGDYNINLLNSDHHGNSSLFIDIMYSYSLFPLINKPTRVTTQSATLIDNIFTNDIHNDNLFNGILLTDISDHFPIFMINTGRVITEKMSFITYRNCSQRNIEVFVNELKNIDWHDLYDKTDARGAFTFFYQKFCLLYHSSFPKISVKVGYSNRKTWLTGGLKKSIKQKNKLYGIFRKSQSCSNEQNYKRYKRILAKAMRFAEKQYFDQAMNNYKNNLKKSWQVLKKIINKATTPNQLPSQFKIGNKIENCPNAIANSFNQFYVNIGPNLARNIPSRTNDPLDYVTGIQNSMFIYDTNCEEVSSVIKHLKNSAPGPDDIDIRIIKKCYGDLVQPLTYLFNLSFNQGIFPDELKIARVIPIYKSDDPSLITNYRPISVLPVFSKILEKLMLKRLNNFFEQFEIFYKLQFGFRSKYSTSLALIYLTDIITQSINNGDTVLGVLIDYRKAFDTVNHEILLNKLMKYGVRGLANKWIRDYLSNRLQFTSYNRIRSSNMQITCGVPQGSIMGPFLFLCYINDLPNVSNMITPLIFADDTNLFITGKDPNALMATLNEELVKISQWTDVNKLSLNTQKTKYIVFTKPRSSITIEAPLLLNNDVITRLHHVNFLGVLIDDKLTWNVHISHISKKISKGIGIICKAKKVMECKTLRTLYFSFIHPYITYGIEIWGRSAAVHLNTILRLQKKAVRLIKSVNRWSESAPLFLDLEILTVYQIYQYQVLTFLYKFKKQTLPSIFFNFFEKLNPNRDTRNNSLLRVPLMNSSYSQRSLRYQGVLVWNNNVNKLHFDITYVTFKKQVRQHIMNSPA